ncbi:GerAB/ArcD/ProY family transporter [Priestia flexa]|uniref:GerAB/ArcD/ProY family transporter n=1 Tax=Priestia flexa TaxID=86664 RepID=UPI0024C03E55|nr:GerAB/ArcD/ProY family transporter [Priestia flexa]WHX80192.1 GerAB/ArcD/ProY family transporter [Priestia flexa]
MHPRLVISNFQLFSMMLLFLFGSATIVSIGQEARQSAWIAVLVGMLMYLPFFALFTLLYKRHPEETFPTILKIAFGKLVGKIICMLYVLYFIYIGARVLRDFCELLLLTSMNDTPLVIVGGVMTLVIAYACFLEVEPIARASVLLLVVFVGFIVLGFCLLFFSDAMNPDRMHPILAEGIGSIFRAVFPLILTFPFGEMVVFLMFNQFIKGEKSLRKMGTRAVLIGGVMLSMLSLISLTTLGQHLVGSSTIPLLVTVQQVNIGDIIQRMDMLAISVLIIGGFAKVTIFAYAAILGIKDIYQTRSHKLSLLFVTISILTTTIFMSDNAVKHLEIGLKIVPVWIHIPMQFVIPIVALVMIQLKSRKKSRST